MFCGCSWPKSKAKHNGTDSFCDVILCEMLVAQLLGYCSVGKIPPPLGGDACLGTEMGGWVGPRLAFWATRHPPPPGGVGVRFCWVLGL